MTLVSTAVVFDLLNDCVICLLLCVRIGYDARCEKEWYQKKLFLFLFCLFIMFVIYFHVCFCFLRHPKLAACIMYHGWLRARSLAK